MDTAEDLGDNLLHSQKIDQNTYDRLQVEAKKILEHAQESN